MSTCDDCCTNVFCSCCTCLLTRLVYLYVSGASFYYVLALFSLSLSMILFTVALIVVFSVTWLTSNEFWLTLPRWYFNSSCFYLMIISYLLVYRDHRVYSQIAFCDIVMDSVWQFDGSDMNCVLNKMLLNINIYV